MRTERDDVAGAATEDSGIRLYSQYVQVDDGTRVAVTTWRPDAEGDSQRRPAAFLFHRYWRATASESTDAAGQRLYPLAKALSRRGFVLVSCDARGSGASFGTRHSEPPPQEAADICTLIDWVSRQSWCDGRVASFGTSYTAGSALLGLRGSSDALRGVVCRAPDLDDYRGGACPGGIVNTFIYQGYGEHLAALDRNESPDSAGGAGPGVRRVDDDVDGTMLAAALAEHASNVRVQAPQDLLVCADDPAEGESRRTVEQIGILFQLQGRIRTDVPIICRVGWHDAGTTRGALMMFRALANPIHLLIGPWSHTGAYHADPLAPGNGTTATAVPDGQEYESIAESLESLVDGARDLAAVRQVSYCTLGENRWKETTVWPPAGSVMRRLYLGPGGSLTYDAPTTSIDCDRYRVDPESGTGADNRWHTQMTGPVLFPDRRDADRRLLTYDSEPLAAPLEITGHPVVRLQLSADRRDAQVFVYLEAVTPDGTVRLLTEGQLRACHRHISLEKPRFQPFGPYHSFYRHDLKALEPGRVTSFHFELFPVSVQLPMGWRLRVAIAGADKDVFAAIPGCEAPELTIMRSATAASWIDLPIVVRT